MLLWLMILTPSCVCDSFDSPQPQIEQSEILKESSSNHGYDVFTLRKFNGHTYVIYKDGCYGSGVGTAMVHDPDCACNMK